MKIRNVTSEQYEDYWDEGQPQSKLVRWYKKGFWKRWYRKKFIRQYIKGLNKE